MPTRDSQQAARFPYSRLGPSSPGSDGQPAPPATFVKRPPPRASVEKANKIFESFSLSNFSPDSLPSNYVHPYKRDASLHHAERTKHVQEMQRKKIEQHLHKLKMTEQREHKNNGKSVIRGLALAVPVARVDALLPSYNKERGSVSLDEVLNLVAKHAKGTEFHANGDPTLTRLAFLARIKRMRKSLRLHDNGASEGHVK